jgi:hypothetical protein
MVEDARVLQSMGDNGPFNYNQGNLQQDAPPVAEFFYPSIFTSKTTLFARLDQPLLTTYLLAQIPLLPKSLQPCLALGQSGRSALPMQQCLLSRVPLPSVSRCTQMPILPTRRIPSLLLSMSHS